MAFEVAYETLTKCLPIHLFFGRLLELKLFGFYTVGKTSEIFRYAADQTVPVTEFSEIYN
jgi:hypothetical protein